MVVEEHRHRSRPQRWCRGACKITLATTILQGLLLLVVVVVGGGGCGGEGEVLVVLVVVVDGVVVVQRDREVILLEVLQEARRSVTRVSVCLSVFLSVSQSVCVFVRPGAGRQLCVGAPILGSGRQFWGRGANFGCKLFFAG